MGREDLGVVHADVVGIAYDEDVAGTCRKGVGGRDPDVEIEEEVE